MVKSTLYNHTSDKGGVIFMSNITMKSLFLKSLRSKQIAITVIVSVVFVSVLSLVLFEGNKKTVKLASNGETFEVKTYAATVGKLLSERDIEVSEHDLVTPSMNTPVESGLSIRWEQSKEVAINIDQVEKSIWTTKETIGEALKEADVEITEHDSVSPSLNTKLEETNQVSIQKAYEFTLIDGKEEKKYWSTSTTVDDFLKREGIQLSEFDRLEVESDELIKPNSVVQVVRVEKVTDVVEEAKNFAVETRSDQALLKGREKVVQQGEAGKVSKKFEIVMENGVEVSRAVVEETVIKEPKKKIIAVGSKVVVATATSASAPTAAKKSGVGVSRSNSAAPSGGKEFYVTATAYTAGCNGCSGITRTGINLKANPNLKVIAVDPNVIPLGSKVWVEGYGYAVAGDTGGAIKGMKIDLHVPNKQAAYKFGRRQVKVKIIN